MVKISSNTSLLFAKLIFHITQNLFHNMYIILFGKMYEINELLFGKWNPFKEFFFTLPIGLSDQLSINVFYELIIAYTKIQNGRQGATKWLTGYGKEFTPNQPTATTTAHAKTR